MNETRESILQGLYGIKGELQQVLSYEQKLRSIDAGRRSERGLIQADNTGTKVWQLVVSLFTAGVVLDLVWSLMSVNVFGIIVNGGVLFLLYKFYKPEWFQDARAKERRKLTAWGIVWRVLCAPFVLMFVLELMASLAGLIGQLFVNPVKSILSIVLAGAVYVFLSRKREQTNAEILGYNEETRALNRQLAAQEAAAREQLSLHIQRVYQLGQGWFPKNYYCMYAVDWFIRCMENYQADSVKEMVNLFEDSEHKRRMEEKQQEIIEGQRRTEQAIQFQTLSNIMNTWAIQDSMNRNASRISSSINRAAEYIRRGY